MFSSWNLGNGNPNNGAPQLETVFNRITKRVTKIELYGKEQQNGEIYEPLETHKTRT